MKKIACSAYLILFTLFLTAQQPEQPLQDNGTLSLGIKSMSFMRNTEYMNPVTEGYTMIGFFIQPTFIYTPVKKFSISLGTQVSGFAGSSSLEKPQLVFSSTWNISPGSKLIIGTLDGSDRHLMEDPVFYREKLYTAFNENGIRIVNDYKRIFSDVWVNWENYIRRGDTTRETFTGGISLRYKTLKFNDHYSIEVPVQVIVKHHGGQVSDYDEECVTYFNAAAGLRFNTDLGEGRLGKAGLEFTQLHYSEPRSNETPITGKGWASWVRLYYDYKFISFCSSYWNSHDFFAPNGNPVFSSVSDYRQGVVIHNREIWTNSLFFKFTPGNHFEFLAGFETWYDTGFNRIDNAFTLHLRFDKLVNLSKVR